MYFLKVLSKPLKSFKLVSLMTASKGIPSKVNWKYGSTPSYLLEEVCMFFWGVGEEDVFVEGFVLKRIYLLQAVFIHTILDCSQSCPLPPYAINKVNVCLHSIRKSDFAKFPRRKVFQGLPSITCATKKKANRKE